MDYRKQIGKTLTAATIKRQLKRLEEFGHDNAIASIEASITHGWTGLYSQNGQAKRSTDGPRARARKGKYDDIDSRSRITG